LKPERWGSPLVQEKYREGKACDKRQPYNNNNNWSHWNSNEKIKEKFGNCTRKTFDMFTTKDSCTWNIAHNTECTAL